MILPTRAHFQLEIPNSSLHNKLERQISLDTLYFSWCLTDWPDIYFQNLVHFTKYNQMWISGQPAECQKKLSWYTKLLVLEGLYSIISQILTVGKFVRNFQGGIRNSLISEEKVNFSSILQRISQLCLWSMLIWFAIPF